MTGGIRASLSSDQFQSLSVSQEILCAASSGSNVVIANIDTKINELLVLSPKSNSGNYTVTDASWNTIVFGRLAVSSTNGAISISDCDNSIFTKVCNKAKTIWDFNHDLSRSVHKLTWLENDAFNFLSANQDGSIRLHDIRVKCGSQPSSTFNPKSEGVRDVQCNPFNQHQFSAISENGTVSSWDVRVSESSLLKFLAHTGSGFSIAYHPSKENVVATGGKDKYVKIWNFFENGDDSILPSIQQFPFTTDSASSSQSPLNLSSFMATTNDKSSSNNSSVLMKPVITIRTSGSVSRIKWRGRSVGHEACLATIASDRSEVSVWNLNYPSLPVCILSGHTDICTSFDWVDTPVSLEQPHSEMDSKPTSSLSLTSLDAVDTEDFRKKNLRKSQTSGPGTAACEYLNVVQHILSVGKDGKMLLHDLRNGYFPRQHVATNVLALSSSGDLALHRGDIPKGDLLNIVINSSTSTQALPPFRDDPQHFGMNFHISSTSFPSNPDIFKLHLQVPGHSLQIGNSPFPSNLASPKTSQNRRDSSTSQTLSKPSQNKQFTWMLGDGNFSVAPSRKSYHSSPDLNQHTSHDAKKDGHLRSSGGSSHEKSIRTTPPPHQHNSISQNNSVRSIQFIPSNQLRSAFSLYQSMSRDPTRTLSYESERNFSLDDPSAVESINIQSSSAYAPIFYLSGCVFAGKTNIDSLEKARVIREEKNGAEGRKFDPAVMRLLAQEYVHNGKAKGLSPRRACAYNMAVAKIAGFSCRVSVWNTVLTLLPSEAIQDPSVLRVAASAGGFPNRDENQEGTAINSLDSDLRMEKPATSSRFQVPFSSQSSTNSLLGSVRGVPSVGPSPSQSSLNLASLNPRQTIASQLQQRAGANNVATSKSDSVQSSSTPTATTPSKLPIQDDPANRVTIAKFSDGQSTVANPVSANFVGSDPSNTQTKVITSVDTLSSILLPDSLPFSHMLIGDILLDLLEIGDCQHFVIICELLLQAGASLLDSCLQQAKITKNRRLEAYYSYIELLRRFKLFNFANEIILQSDLAAVPALSQSGVLIRVSCATCGKELPDRLSNPWCQKCRKQVGLCSICHEPVRGLFRWCAVCSHGGHVQCLTGWFKSRGCTVCPSGCGHVCNALQVT